MKADLKKESELSLNFHGSFLNANLLAGAYLLHIFHGLK